ncbi:ATP-binding protein [Steroidobacter cummioxidans]|uniref:ATP-binding protein n=1 Tax=Steroidobacter cummioxidans TaxID=1803913 RepID=UPI000E323EAE|nr:ATP-binding protein [Steroidobacter cummioxidans]
MPPSAAPSDLPTFNNGSELGRLVSAFDWSNTPLGPLERWPQSLRTAVNLVLDSRHPMWMSWGPRATFIYNDAYVQVLGPAKHPWALGRPAEEVWAEIWDVCGPLADKVFQHGEASFVDDVQLFMSRGDFLEETYYSFSYSPIRDETGQVAGLFCPSAETTHKVLNARRLRTLSELAAKALVERSVETACTSAIDTLAKNPEDVPFALLYRIDPVHRRAVLNRSTGMTDADDKCAPRILDLDAESPLWPVCDVVESCQPRTLHIEPSPSLPLGPAARPIVEAMLVPVMSGGQEQPTAVLISGINPTRRLDEEYRTFFNLIASHVATAIHNARAVEEERERAERLAELDRAKTTFFSNVSHEFRTPLTLMMGPLEDALADADAPLAMAQKERLQAAHRNSLRLLRLVNTLLDFSRIEAGRTKAKFRPTDLAMLTAELTSTFRSALTRASLKLTVDCPTLPEPVFVDREMWEKIVLNLLSNAFKFTFEGGVEVRLRAMPQGAELTVKDSGVGVPPEELPRLFERFHRIEGQKSRTHEGSGIGLALIMELVRLHHGKIHADSRLREGTTFTVTIPFGSHHLPADQIYDASINSAPDGERPHAFVQEALTWLSDAGLGIQEYQDISAGDDLAQVEGSRLLLADDNADMRQYVSRLLSKHLHVEAVADGAAALAAIRGNRPDLVLTDVMMPELDGFGLLKAIREDPELRDLPVIMLSARAGEEARIEGLHAGADDYLIKPFSARELTARVHANLKLANVRRESTAALAESEQRFRNMAENSPLMMWITDAEGQATYLNKVWHDFTGQTEAEALGLGWTNAVHPDDRATATRQFLDASAEHKDFRMEYRLRRHDGEYRWAIDAASPRFNGEGEFLGYIGSVIDITERKQAEEALLNLNETLKQRVESEIEARGDAEKALRQAQKMESLGQLTGGIAHDFNNMLNVVIGNIDMLSRRLARGDTNVQRFASFALDGATRAAQLTERLLAFARQQPLRPEPINANKLVAGMSDLLHRTLGETIRTETVLAGGLWKIHTDANQLESAILNLAVNARDAMPGGGKLTVETANAHLDDTYAAQHAGVPQGQYVMIAVTDTGCGMSADVIQKAFDPFFTTKSVGKGTGLGLSQVHGFVHQSGGYVKIYSEISQGTTVKIYLPRFYGASEDVQPNARFTPGMSGAGMTILVVEDEESVRHVSVEALTELGYNVLEANGAAMALRLLDQHPEIDIMFTDVVMPEVNGRMLADEARQRRPDLKVLFTTGYTRNAIVHNGVLDPGVHLIGKPFNLEQLARKLAEIKDA